VETKTAAA